MSGSAMRSPGEIWRKRLWLWVPALVFFLANFGIFSVYRWGYAGQVQNLEAQLTERDKDLAERRAARRAKEGLFQRAQVNAQRIDDFYAERLSTRRRRMTDVNGEFNRMAAKAGLTPKSVSFPEEQIEDFGLVKRSFVFSVEGTYAELRQLINLLELSESFLTLEQVTLTEGGQGPQLHMNLRISTLFANEDGTPAVTKPAEAARAQKGTP